MIPINNMHRIHLASKYCTYIEAKILYSYGLSQLGMDAVGVPSTLEQVRAFIDKRKPKLITVS